MRMLNFTYAIGLIQIRLFVCIVPAFCYAVLRHCLDPYYSSWEFGIHCIFVVMWRLAAEGSSLCEVVSSDPSAFEFIFIFSIVAPRMQVAPVALMVAHAHPIHLFSNMLIKLLACRYPRHIYLWQSIQFWLGCSVRRACKKEGPWNHKIFSKPLPPL